jgi:biopolymer transport protein TolR
MSDRVTRMQRHHRRHRGGGGLNLVSLMDIFTILVFFLLVNSTEVETLPSDRSLTLPESVARELPRETVVVAVTLDDIIVQGRRVASVAEVLAEEEGTVIPALEEALRAQHARALRSDAGGAEVTIMGDRELPYRLLRRIMATCTEADYARLSLAVNQRVGDTQIAQLR